MRTTHKTKDGKEIPITSMTNAHLERTMEIIRNVAFGTGYYQDGQRWHGEEALRRMDFYSYYLVYVKRKCRSRSDLDMLLELDAKLGEIPAEHAEEPRAILADLIDMHKSEPTYDEILDILEAIFRSYKCDHNGSNILKLAQDALLKSGRVGEDEVKQGTTIFNFMI